MSRRPDFVVQGNERYIAAAGEIVHRAERDFGCGCSDVAEFLIEPPAFALHEIVQARTVAALNNYFDRFPRVGRDCLTSTKFFGNFSMRVRSLILGAGFAAEQDSEA